MIATTIIGPAKPFFDIQSEQQTIAFADGSGEYVFNIERKDEEFKAELNVIAEGLPPGIEASVKPDKDKYTATITSDKKNSPGDFTLRLVSIGEHQGRGQVLVKEVNVQVVDSGSDE